MKTKVQKYLIDLLKKEIFMVYLMKDKFNFQVRLSEEFF